MIENNKLIVLKSGSKGVVYKKRGFVDNPIKTKYSAKYATFQQTIHQMFIKKKE